MTYAELYQIIADFAVDAEATFLSHIPDFVRATEKRIFNDTNLPLAQLQASVSTVIGDPEVGMPADFLSMDSLQTVVSGAVVFPLLKDITFLLEAFPVSTAQGAPRYYAVKNSTTLQIAPYPNAIYPLTLRYFGYPESVVTAGSTWLSTNYEFALQYGALRDAAVFLKEEADVVAMYEKSYAEALSQVKNFGDNRARMDTYRRK